MSAHLLECLQCASALKTNEIHDFKNLESKSFSNFSIFFLRNEY